MSSIKKHKDKIIRQSRIGYACITLGVSDVRLQTCRLKNADDERIIKIIENNLNTLEKAIEYNNENDIKLFRISSDIIPFASHPDISIEWCRIFRSRIKEIGDKIKQYGIRVSMHPGQYTVINSINEEVVQKSIEDLKYHSYFLDCLGMDGDSKVILHIGGVYGDKESAVQRFIENYNKLEDSVKSRLVIENDDSNYNIEDVLYISKKAEIPVVFDNLHHSVNPPDTDKSVNNYIQECAETWKKKDGRQKIHYSQQDESKSKGAHSRTIEIHKFIEFYNNTPMIDFDIMLEVKDKNLSAIKCILCTTDEKNIGKTEKEWARYKYYVLGKNPEGYLRIRELLKNKEENSIKEFYSIVEESIKLPSKIDKEINAAQHVFGYFKKTASIVERKRIINTLAKYREEKATLGSVKNGLKKLAYKYKVDYLLDSYYFVEL